MSKDHHIPGIVPSHNLGKPLKFSRSNTRAIDPDSRRAFEGLFISLFLGLIFWGIVLWVM